MQVISEVFERVENFSRNATSPNLSFRIGTMHSPRLKESIIKLEWLITDE